MSKQHKEINVAHRALVIDCLCELQEQFELNHETLYLGVKLFDLFMDRVPKVKPLKLKLIGNVALSIAIKFDVYLFIPNCFVIIIAIK
jgi:cyclin B